MGVLDAAFRLSKQGGTERGTSTVFHGGGGTGGGQGMDVRRGRHGIRRGGRWPAVADGARCARAGGGSEAIGDHQRATAQSMTFRELVDRINATDGIVYVSEGQCGHGVRACLSNTMTMAGPNRVLRILIDARKT